MAPQYSTDRALLKRDQDKFQRSEFSLRIAKTIIERKDDDCLVIGLYGAWGGGKTTVLNFIEEELEKAENIRFLKFNPWKSMNEADLLLSFFVKVAETLDEKLFNGIEKYSKKAEGLGGLFSVVGVDATSLINKFSSVDIEELKSRVDKFLLNSNFRLVVVIDDIDRLDKYEISLILKLVKLTADFAKTTYLLSFDDKMVAAAIGERFGKGDVESGNSFLEKIIQVPIRLPQIPYSSLKSYCLDNVSNSLKDNLIELNDDSFLRFRSAFEQFVLPRLTTPRVAVRYANSLSFSLPLLQGEVDTVDLMLIESIKIFYPDYYLFIKDNSEYFVDTSFLLSLSKDKKISQLLERINEFPSSSNIRYKESALSFMQELFPNINSLLNDNVRLGNVNRESNWYRDKRISSIQYFNRYFTYSVSEGDLSDIIVEKFVDSIAESENSDISSNIKELISASSPATVIKKLNVATSHLSWQVTQKLILVMVEISDYFANKSMNSYFEMRFDRHSLPSYIFDCFFYNRNDENNFSFAKKLMTNAQTISSAYDINENLRRKYRNDEQLFSRDQFLELGSVLRERALNEISPLPIFEKIQSVRQIRYLFDNWKNVDAIGFQSYITDEINKDYSKLGFLLTSVCAEMVTSVDENFNRKVNFDEDTFLYLRDHIDVEEVYKIVTSNFDVDGEINNIDSFSDKVQTQENVYRQFVYQYNKHKLIEG